MKKNALEWTVLALSALLVGAVVAFLVYDAVQAKTKEPDLVVLLGKGKKQTSGYLVPVTVENRGDQTVEGVTIDVELTPADGGEKETAPIEFQFLPRQSKREGWVQLDTDPSTGKLKANVQGFEKP